MPSTIFEEFTISEKIIIDISVISFILKNVKQSYWLKTFRQFARLDYKKRLEIKKHFNIVSTKLSSLLHPEEIIYPLHPEKSKKKSFYISIHFLKDIKLPCILHELLSRGMFLRLKNHEKKPYNVLLKHYVINHKYPLIKKLLSFHNNLDVEEFLPITDKYFIKFLDKKYPSIVDEIIMSKMVIPNKAYWNHTTFFKKRMDYNIFKSIPNTLWRRKMIKEANFDILYCKDLFSLPNLTFQEFKTIIKEPAYRLELYMWSEKEWKKQFKHFLKRQNLDILLLFILTRNRLEKINRQNHVFLSEEPEELTRNDHLWVQDSVHLKMYSAESFLPFSESVFLQLLKSFNMDFLDTLVDTSFGIESILEMVKKYGYQEKAFKILKEITNVDLFSFWSLFYFMGIGSNDDYKITSQEQRTLLERIFVYIAMFQGNSRKYTGWFKKTSIIDYIRFIPDKQLVTKIVLSIQMLDSILKGKEVEKNISPIWYWDCYNTVMNFLEEFQDREVFSSSISKSFRDCLVFGGKKLFNPEKQKPLKITENGEISKTIYYNDASKGLAFFGKIYSPYPLQKVDEYYFQYEFPSHYANDEYVFNELEFNHGKFFNDHKHTIISNIEHLIVKPRPIYSTFLCKSLVKDKIHCNIVGKYTLYKNLEDVYGVYDIYFYTVEQIPWNVLVNKEDLHSPPCRQYVYSYNSKSIISGIVV